MLALSALSTPGTKSAHPSSTTRGFRMLGIHACESLQPSTLPPRGKSSAPGSRSTEYLYPSPDRDFKLAHSAESSWNMKSGGNLVDCAGRPEREPSTRPRISQPGQN